MGSNRYKPHLLVLLEDKANRQILNGFLLNYPSSTSNAIQSLGVAGGWKKVVEKFKDEQVSKMYDYPNRRIVLIIDFDDHEERLSQIQKEIPNDLQDRVFILGTLSEPEKLRTQLNMKFEKIGQALAQDCADNTQTVWGHPLLKHNESELGRMVKNVKPFLFNRLGS